jgi:hypothetical protein
MIDKIFSTNVKITDINSVGGVLQAMGEDLVF